MHFKQNVHAAWPSLQNSCCKPKGETAITGSVVKQMPHLKMLFAAFSRPSSSESTSKKHECASFSKPRGTRLTRVCSLQPPSPPSFSSFIASPSSCSRQLPLPPQISPNIRYLLLLITRARTIASPTIIIINPSMFLFSIAAIIWQHASYIGLGSFSGLIINNNI